VSLLAPAPQSEAKLVRRPEGFAARLGGRAISLGSMPVQLRFLFWVAVVQLILASLFVAGRDLPLPQLVAYPLGDQVIEVPVPLFWLSVASLVLAVSYLLTGALHSHWPVRLVGLVSYTGLALWLTASRALRWAPILLLLVAAIWVVGLASWWRDRGRESRLRLGRLAVVLGLVLAFYTAAWVSAADLAAERFFGLAVTVQLQVLALFLIPILFLTGSDFAEWGEVISNRVALVAERFKPPYLLAGLLAVSAAAILVWEVRSSGWGLLPGLALGTLTAAAYLGLARIVRPGPRFPSRIPYGALFASAIVYILIFFGTGLIALATAGLIHATTTSELGAPAIPAASLTDRVIAMGALPWLAIGVVAAVLAFKRARLPEPSALASGSFFIVVVAATFVLTSLAPIGITLFGHGADSLPRLRLAYLRVTVAVIALIFLGWLALTRQLRAQAPGLAALFVLLGALQLLDWIRGVYAAALDVSGRFSVLQGLLILGALLWDVLMSGKSVTNVYGRRLPRHARVLLFLGYEMLVATAVLYFSSARDHSTGHAVDSLFDSDPWVLFGLVALGMPMLVCLFLLKAGRVRGHRQLDLKEDEVGPRLEPERA
jgi:hypothetical protein